MAKCCFSQIWMKHHSSISMSDKDPPLGNPRFIEAVFVDILKELTNHPFNHVPKEQATSCVDRVNSLIRKSIKKKKSDKLPTPKSLSDDVIDAFVKAVGGCTHLRLSIFTHLIVGRFLVGTKNLVFVETTLELLQYVSITIPDPDFDGSVFHGDQHGCQLFCWRCRRGFGNIVELDELLAKAPVDILVHFDL